MSVRGGSERARYYVMANYYKQDGNYKHTDMADYSTQAVFQRYNFRANVDVDITKNFMLRSTWVHALPTVMPQVQPLARGSVYANTQPPHLPITLQDNGNAANETYALNNPKGMLYGDQQHRYNILGELSRTGYLNEKKKRF